MLQKPSPELLKLISEIWDLESPLRYLQFSESFVYESTRKGRDVICRVMPNVHRKLEEVISELDWLKYLSDAKMNVASPIASTSGHLVENINLEGSFHVSLFEKAKGKSLRKPGEFTLPIFKEWGQYLGKMHLLTKSYTPDSSIKPRQNWRDTPSIKLSQMGLDKKDKIPHDRFLNFYTWLQTLETDRDCFGLVHADLHSNNFFVDKGKITAFDFDDCCYHWFSFDLAVPLFSVMRIVREQESMVTYEKAFDEYLTGYLLENTLDQQWIDRIELFVQFRVCNMYHWIKGRHKQGSVTDSQKMRNMDWLAWSAEQMESKPLKLI